MSKMSGAQEIVPLLRLAEAGTPHVIDNALMLGELTNGSLFQGLVSAIKDKKTEGTIREAAISRLGTFAKESEFRNEAFETLKYLTTKKRAYHAVTACELCRFGSEGIEEVRKLILKHEEWDLEPPRDLMKTILEMETEAIPLILTFMDRSLSFSKAGPLYERLREFGDDAIEPILDHLLKSSRRDDSLAELLAERSDSVLPILRKMALDPDLKVSKTGLKVLSHFKDNQDLSMGTILDRIELDLEAAEKQLNNPEEVPAEPSSWNLKRIFDFLRRSTASANADKTYDKDPLEAFYDLEQSCMVAGFGNSFNPRSMPLSDEGAEVLFNRAPPLIIRAAELISNEKYLVPYNPADDVMSLLLIRDVAGETHHQFLKAYTNSTETMKKVFLTGITNAVYHLNSIVCEPVPLSEIDEDFRFAIEFSRRIDPTDRSDMAKLNATAALLRIIDAGFHELAVEDLSHTSFEVRREAFNLIRAIIRSGIGVEMTGNLQEVLSQAAISNLDPEYLKSIDSKERFEYFSSISGSCMSAVIDKENAIFRLALILDDPELRDLRGIVINEVAKCGHNARFVIPKLDKILRGDDSNLAGMAAKAISNILKP